jgi:hypothetical protein
MEALLPTGTPPVMTFQVGHPTAAELLSRPPRSFKPLGEFNERHAARDLAGHHQPRTGRSVIGVRAWLADDGGPLIVVSEETNGRPW